MTGDVRCPQCSYTLHDVTEQPRCPECGFNMRDARLVIPAWRDPPSRWNAIMAGGSTLLCIYLLVAHGFDPLQIFVTAAIGYWFWTAIVRYRRAQTGERELVLVVTESNLLLLTPDARRAIPLAKIGGVSQRNGRLRMDFASPLSLTDAAITTSLSMWLWLDADEATAARLEQEIARLRTQDDETPADQP